MNHIKDKEKRKHKLNLNLIYRSLKNKMNWIREYKTPVLILFIYIFHIIKHNSFLLIKKKKTQFANNPINTNILIKVMLGLCLV